MLYSIFNKIVLNYEIGYKTFTTISKEQMSTKKENKLSGLSGLKTNYQNYQDYILELDNWNPSV